MKLEDAIELFVREVEMLESVTSRIAQPDYAQDLQFPIDLEHIDRHIKTLNEFLDKLRVLSGHQKIVAAEIEHHTPRENETEEERLWDQKLEIRTARLRRLVEQKGPDSILVGECALITQAALKAGRTRVETLRVLKKISAELQG
jgi:hypothetical protein